MTYRPVENPSGAGRKSLPIPDSLLSQLEHTYAHGKRAEIPIGPDTNPDDVAELRRTLVRAGYRHFPDKSVRYRFTDELITFWLADKRKAPAGPRRARGSRGRGKK